MKADVDNAILEGKEVVATSQELIDDIYEFATKWNVATVLEALMPHLENVLLKWADEKRFDDIVIWVDSLVEYARVSRPLFESLRVLSPYWGAILKCKEGCFVPYYMWKAIVLTDYSEVNEFELYSYFDAWADRQTEDTLPPLFRRGEKESQKGLDQWGKPTRPAGRRGRRNMPFPGTLREEELEEREKFFFQDGKVLKWQQTTLDKVRELGPRHSSLLDMHHIWTDEKGEKLRGSRGWGGGNEEKEKEEGIWVLHTAAKLRSVFSPFFKYWLFSPKQFQTMFYKKPYLVPLPYSTYLTEEEEVESLTKVVTKPYDYLSSRQWHDERDSFDRTYNLMRGTRSFANESCEKENRRSNSGERFHHFYVGDAYIFGFDGNYYFEDSFEQKVFFPDISFGVGRARGINILFPKDIIHSFSLLVKLDGLQENGRRSHHIVSVQIEREEYSIYHPLRDEPSDAMPRARNPYRKKLVGPFTSFLIAILQTKCEKDKRQMEINIGVNDVLVQRYLWVENAEYPYHLIKPSATAFWEAGEGSEFPMMGVRQFPGEDAPFSGFVALKENKDDDGDIEMKQNE